MNDLKQAKDELQLYEDVFGLCEYASEIGSHTVVLMTKYAQNNERNPLTIYRYVRLPSLDVYNDFYEQFAYYLIIGRS